MSRLPKTRVTIAATVLSACWVMWIATAGCAHQGPSNLVSTGGILSVENTMKEPVEVFLAGKRAARVDPGASVVIDRLPIGKSEVVAVGEFTGHSEKTAVNLTRGERQNWLITAGKEHEEALASLPTGSIKAVNHAPEPIRVSIDGEPHEMIWPGAEVVYGDVRTGVHRLEAVGVKSGFTVDDDVTVGPGVVPVFSVSPPRSALRIENRSGFALKVTVGDVTDVHLKKDGFRVIKGLAVGSLPILARDLMGRDVWSGSVDLQPGATASLVIPLPKGVLAVVSYVDRELSVIADGRRLGECDATGAAEFRGLAPGMTRLQALSGDGKVVARARVEVPTEGQGVWMVKPGFGSESAADEGRLLVINRRKEPISLRVDGWDRGEVAPGGRRLIPSLLPGQHSADAVGKRSGEVFGADIDIGISEQITWEAMPSVALLALTNTREEEVRVLIDDAEVALLAPSQSLELRVESGRHILHARGVTTRKSTDHPVDLPASTTTSLELPSPSASMVVTNRFQEPLSLGYGDRDLGVILPGDKVTFTDLEPGSWRMVARSLKRPLSWSVSVRLVAGEKFVWELKD